MTPTNDAPVTVEREALEQAVAVLERLPYGDWPGPMYSGKTVAANALIRRLRAALASAPAGDGVAAFEAAAVEAERIGTRWAEDTDHPATSRAVGKAIAASIRSLARPRAAVGEWQSLDPWVLYQGEALVENVARAIAGAVYNQSDSGVYPKWSDFRDEARAAILALQSPPAKVEG